MLSLSFPPWDLQHKGWLLVLLAWKPTPSLQAVGTDAIPCGSSSYLGQE